MQQDGYRTCIKNIVYLLLIDLSRHNTRLRHAPIELVYRPVQTVAQFYKCYFHNTMQDEILKHTKKIYATSKNASHSFGEKVREIIVEILIIVFAVSLSIWFHNWSEHRHQQTETREFLEDLKVDLKNDIADMEAQNQRLTAFATKWNLFSSFTKSQVDSLVRLREADRFYFNLNPVSKIRNTGNYEGFRSSGKIGQIEDRHLKNLILNYYQKHVPEKDDWQAYYNSLIFEIGKEVPSNKYETLITSVYASEKAKGILQNCELQAQEIVRVNNNVVKAAKEILAEIDNDAKK